jgi:hypothetical protein
MSSWARKANGIGCGIVYLISAVEMLKERIEKLEQQR